MKKLRSPKTPSKNHSPGKDGLDCDSRLDITGRHLTVTKPMKRLIEEKSEKLFSSRTHHIHVSISLQKSIISVTIVASVGKEVFKVSSSEENAYTAIIHAFHKIQEQIDRHLKQKQSKTKHKQSISEIEEELLKYSENDNDYLDLNPQSAIDDGFIYLKTTGRLCPRHGITSREKMKIKTFTQEEAILHMETESDPTLLFFGEDDKKIKIIYRIGDGNYGIIESEGYFSRY